jgi:hypothetical protein
MILQTDGFSNAFVSAKSEINHLKVSGEKVNKKILTWFENYTPYLDTITYGFFGYFTIAVIMQLFSIAGIMGIILYDSKDLTPLGHCGWLYASFSIISGLVLCCICVLTGGMMMDTCGVIEQAFTSEGIDNYHELVPIQLSRLADACLFRNLNIVKI